jgi:hypothetical protein
MMRCIIAPGGNIGGQFFAAQDYVMTGFKSAMIRWCAAPNFYCFYAFSIPILTQSSKLFIKE